MTRKRNQRKLITSGDRLADWIFSRAIHALNQRVEGIYVKRMLRERHGDRTEYDFGYLENGVIYLSSAMHLNRTTMARTLLHEALHAAFGDVPERNILSLEGIVWKRLSGAQTAILKSYIPRHHVKESYEP